MNPVHPITDATAGLTRRAQALADLGRPQEAVAVLLQCLSRSPGDYRALCLLSLAHGNAGNLSEAERCAERAIEAAPDKEWGHRLLAIHLLAQGGPNTALPAAEEAARLAPEEPKALYTLANAQRQCGKPREARKTAERLRAIAPDTLLTHNMLAMVSIQQAKWSEAEAHARRALAVEANAYTAHNNLGIAISNQSNEFEPQVSAGRFLEAMDCLCRAMTLDPAADLPRKNLREALARFLLVRTRIWSWLLTLGLLLVSAWGLWAAPGPRGLYGLLLLLGAAVLVPAARWTVLSRARFRALPPPVQDFWRRQCNVLSLK